MLPKKGRSSGFSILSGRSRRSVDLRKLLSKAEDCAPPPPFDDDMPVDYDNGDIYGKTLPMTIKNTELTRTL